MDESERDGGGGATREGRGKLSQQFHQQVSLEAWIAWLDRLCPEGEPGRAWLVDVVAYRRGMYHGWIEAFVRTHVLPNYQPAIRRKFEAREITFPLFLTYCRQIARMHGFTMHADTTYYQSQPFTQLHLSKPI